jgi:NAD(P)-dependent dehydrogenase (short-subunit alcohol dehydrogenase family)
VSRRLASTGARVAVAGKDPAGVRAALGQLDGPGHLGLELDVSSQTAWLSVLERLDWAGPVGGVVAAAGVLGPVGPLEQTDPAELERAIRVNLIGTMLALHHMLPRLRDTGGRAVTFSGGGATAPLPRYDAYAASKAGVVRLTENVAADGAVEINCIAPGFVATRIHEGTLEAGPEVAGRSYYEKTRAELARGGVPASEVAELACLLLSRAAHGITGRLLSAQWDPWRDSAFLERLRREPHLATLRRIDESQFVSAGPRESGEPAPR